MPPTSEQSNDAPLRVAIVEDEGLLRDLLHQVLDSVAGIDVVGTFPDAESASQGLADLAIDVLLVDIHLGAGPNGIALALARRAVQPRLGVVLLSNQRDPELLSALPPHELHGLAYLTKTSVADVPTLVRAIRGAADGMVVLDPSIAGGLMPRRSPQPPLGARAESVLRLVAQGYSNASIGKQLGLAEKSVENVLSQLYRQLEIDTGNSERHPRVRATLHYLALG